MRLAFHSAPWSRCTFSAVRCTSVDIGGSRWLECQWWSFVSDSFPPFLWLRPWELTCRVSTLLASCIKAQSHLLRWRVVSRTQHCAWLPASSTPPSTLSLNAAFSEWPIRTSLLTRAWGTTADSELRSAHHSFQFFIAESSQHSCTSATCRRTIFFALTRVGGQRSRNASLKPGRSSWPFWPLSLIVWRTSEYLERPN